MRKARAEIGDFLTREPPEVHALGCFVHGALTALHTLGAVYNYRRRNWGDVAAHIAAALYDARSARHHYRMEQIALRRRSASAGRPRDSSPPQPLGPGPTVRFNSAATLVAGDSNGRRTIQ